jgi:hypothetical protein
MITMKKIFMLALLLWALAPALHAQTYSINWHKVAGGGGTSAGTISGTVYSLSGTIGQHDASGALTGGNYSLTGGYWSLLSVIQTVNAPLLSITHTGSASVVVSWSSSATGFVLQQNSNLANTNTWTTSGYTITTAGGTNSITVAPPSGSLFFRLVQP